MLTSEPPDDRRAALNAPVCTVCAGKGWISPDDAERAIQANGELFTAGYAHRKQHFEASAVAVQSLDTAAFLKLRTWDAIQDRAKAGESVASLAQDYAVPERWIAFVLLPENSVTNWVAVPSAREALLERMRFVANAAATDSFGNPRAVATEIRQWVAALDRGDAT